MNINVPTKLPSNQKKSKIEIRVKVKSKAKDPKDLKEDRQPSRKI